MYLIKSGNNIIYDSRDKDTYPVIKPSFQEGLNEAGTLTFTLLPGHPHYDKMKKMQTFVTAYRDNTELFYGRVLITDKELDGRMEVTCEGGLTFLLDSELDKGEHNESIASFFRRCINNHNSQVEAAKRLTIGTISATKALDTSKTYDFDLNSYTNTKSAIESLITGRFGGYVRVRPNGSSGHAIDYLEDYGRANSQPIQIGHNVVDKSDHISGEQMFTILRPIGKRQPTGREGSSEDTDVTIESMPQSAVTIPNVTINGKFLRLNDKISQYGIIIRTEQFNSAETPADLLKKAEEYITRRGTQLPATCEVNMVDFYHLNPTVMDVRLGDTFNNIEGFSGQTMTVSEISLDLENPGNDTVKFANMEEINSNRLDYNVESKGLGTSGGSSSSSLTKASSNKNSSDSFRYKYYEEKNEWASIHTKNIEINASDTFSSLSNKIFLTVEDAPGSPGELILKAVKDAGNPNGSELVMNVDGFRLSAKAGYEQTKEGKVVASDYATAANLEVQADRITAEVSRATAAEGTMSSRITQTADAITSEVSRATTEEETLSSRITQTADQIALKVSKGDISTQLAVECGNISISGGNLIVDGYISAEAAKTGTVQVNVLGLGNYIAGSDGQAYRPHFVTMSGMGSAASQKFLGNGDLELDHYHAITATESGGNITITLGAVQSTPGTADFDIAATTTYKDGVAAAKKKMGVKIDTSEQTVEVAESTTKSAYIASLVELTYNTNNHKYIALSKATANGTTVNTDTKTSGTEAYEAGWDAACDKIKREGNSIIGPKKGDVGKTETKYTANYVASTYTKETTETKYYTALATPSSYSASTHSRTGASVTIPGHGTITSTKGVTVTNLSGVISFNAGSDSYKSSSYEAETTAVGSYTKLKTSSIYKNSTFSWS